MKAKITLLIIFIVAGVLFLTGYLDYHFARKDQINLFLDRNVYIAKQIDAGIPDQKIMRNLPHIREEVEEWLLSRPSLMEIDIFLFSAKGWETVVSTSKWNVPKAPLTLSTVQIHRLKNDKQLSLLHEAEDEKGLEVIVPLHPGKKVMGGQ